MSCSTLDNIKTGDLLAWSNYGQEKSSFWLNLVRVATMSDYGHVSVAWRKGNKLFHVEAAPPYIRVSPISLRESFSVVTLSDLLTVPPDMPLYFADKIGKRYSRMDALRAYINLEANADDRWQCAELANDFYRHHGVNLGSNALTPTRLVNAALSRCGVSLSRVNAVNF